MSTCYWQTFKRKVSLQEIRDSAKDLGWKVIHQKYKGTAIVLADEEGNTVWCYGEGKKAADFKRYAGNVGADVLLKKICDYFKVGIKDEHGDYLHRTPMEELRYMDQAFAQCWPSGEAIRKKVKKEVANEKTN